MGSTEDTTKDSSVGMGSTEETTKDSSVGMGSTEDTTKDSRGVMLSTVGTTKEGATTVSCFKGNLKAHLLMAFILVGVVAGFGLGYGIRALEPSDDALMWIGLPGEMYMRMLQMMILPLIICSVITGTASVDPKCNGRVSVAALTYIMVTNTFPCLLYGACLRYKTRRGDERHEGDVVAQTDPENIIATQDIFADLIRNIAPSNLITACFQQAQTKYAMKEEITIRNVSGILENITTITKTRVPGASNSPNALGLVLCCMMFGIAISVIGEAAKPFFVFFEAATIVIFKILNWLIWYTPIGVLSLIAVAIARADNILDTFRSLGLFASTVVVGLLLYQFIILPLGILALTRRNPYKIQMEYSRAWMVTFAAASSAVAMPEGLLALARLRIDKRVAQFVVPLATATNRDGSTMFMAAACIFICQIEGIEVDGSKIITIWILTAALSLAIPALPSSSIVCIIIILSALGIPIEQTGLLFAMDWFLDRMRGGVNQISIGYCAVVAYHFSKSVLPKEEDEDQEEDDFEV
ncbi:LOW QUALITY PROTEIN: excitatory amino acid transporter-like [Haliotis rubra]|uniref:LOW QUALITY PROTEIN: excitatory amino acid transporter-like n=1 Tax=Haliotis rubra TaxID=36100 RepID=UPI001EE5F805|nr:LOW QUALITY PROTEIN: excitatory amino acid transporter-like [Haliotis rubra]